MSVPTLFARISTLVMNHTLKSVRSRGSYKASRRQASQKSFTHLVEEMEQRVLLSGTTGQEEVASLAFGIDENGNEVVGSPAYDPLLDGARLVNAGETNAVEAPPFPLSQTFLLHSNPGADMIVYLDFNGHVTSGTGWQSGASFTSPAYDLDGDPFTFNDVEQERIQRAWQRVAEDFAPFNIDITTEEPDIERLRNSGGFDSQWGVRMVISGDDGAWQGGSSGGVAFLNSFNDSIDTPAFAFQANLGGGAEKPVGEVISHEVGHTLGLSHDGQGATVYYPGHGAGATGWAPIMGVGYYQDVTQWSSGEYANSTTTEDDLAIITTGNGFGYRADDHGNTISSGSPLTGTPGLVTPGVYNISGIIETRTDSDWITFEVDSAQSFTLNANPYEWGANLDILAELYDNTGLLLASSNPTDALNANLTAALSAGTYHIRIDGVGVRNVDDGYSDYASLGQYTVTVGLSNLINTPPTINNQIMSVNENSPVGTHVGFVAATDPENDPLVYSIISGNASGAFAINSTNGRITVANTVPLDFEVFPTYQLTVRVTETGALPNSAQATVTINLNDLNDPPVVTPGQIFTIPENSGAGTIVGTVLATDEDGDTIGFSIVGGNTDNAFVIDTTTGVITVFNPSSVDFETNPQFNLVVQVTDDGAGNVTSTEIVTVNLLDEPNLNFVRLAPLGSQVFADQNRQITLSGPGDEVVLDFYGQAGELFSAVLTPTDPNAIVTLELVELNQAFSSTVPGEPLVISAELLPISQSYRVRITSTVADTLTLDTYLNASLEQQVASGDSSAFTPVAIDDSLIDFGVQRYAILGSSSSAFDGDVYEIDLTGRVGEKIEIVLDGLTEDFGGAILELKDQFGATLATASAMPLGLDPSNFDLAILDFEVTADGIYDLVLTSPGVTGEYVITVVTESIGFEVDPNNDPGVPLRDLTNFNGVTGYLSDLALNSPVLSKLGRLELAALLNLPPAAMTAILPVGTSYEEFLASLAPQTSSTFANLPVGLIGVGESEPNDNIGQANQVPLGFNIGEDPNVQITGSLSQSITVIPINGVEDDGDINRATETTITRGQQATASGVIGDGPFAATNGDYDFYAVRNVLAGSRISIDIDARVNGSSLDSFIALYDAAGNIVAINDDSSGSLDSQLLYAATTAGDYFVAVFGFGQNFIGDPFDSATGSGGGSTGTYDITIGLDTSDFDFFEVNLNAGDIFNAWNSGSGSILTFYDSSGQLLMQSSQNASGNNPIVSPLRNPGNASLSWVTDTTGTYYVSLGGGSGAYNLNLEVHRPELETLAPGNHQILFLDFDGATINPGIFGGANGTATLSGLSTFIGGWGLTAGDESAVIDAIIASVTESLSQDLRIMGNNGDFDTSFNNGEFDIEILNSRDHADPFGQANVSRVIIGGTIGQLGIPTLGIAESIDVGNFETEETAVVLLDLLSAAATDPNSLNQYQIASGSSKIELIGVGVGNIVVHEAGHYFGNWHTNQFNSTPNIMDQGGNLRGLVGVGQDSIWGSADDVDVDFGDDTFVPNEGFIGTEDTLNVVSFGLSTGNTTSDLVGPRVVSVTPSAGITSGSISTLSVEFSERITAQSATIAANFQLISAGSDGVFNTADDVLIATTPSFDGDRTVTLTINPGDAPLVAAKYRLTIDGDQSAIRDLASNPLNNVNGGPGSDTVHEFEVAQTGVFPLDVYTVTLNAGESLFLSTSTPLDSPFGNPPNLLDPSLTVRNPDGLLAATDDNSAPDSRNAQLSFVATQSGIYEIEVSANSGFGEYVINLIINHPPDILDDVFTIPENSPIGTVVGTPSASDPDLGDQVTYAIIGGNPNNTFAINPTTGEITVNNPALLDFETTPFFDLTVQVTDNGVENLTDTAIVRVNLTDVNETPTINNQLFNIDENAPNTAVVGQMIANDVDASDTLVFTIESGNLNGAFVIDSVTGVISVANSAELDFETTPQFVLQIRVTDAIGLFAEADATIVLNDINDQPVINDQTFQVAENSPGGTVVGTVLASDEDRNPPDQLSFTILSGNTNSAFAIDAVTGVITIINPLAVNFETHPFFNLQVQVKDNGIPSLSDTATIRINVLNRPDGVRVPFFDGFETYPVVNPPGNPLPPGSPWIINSTHLGRVRVTDLYQPFEGNKHLLLESSVVDNIPSLNEVVLEFNPNGAEQIFLEFAQREFNDEDHVMPAIFNGSSNSDGVAFSSDGNTWYRIVSLTGNTSTTKYQQFSFDLTILANEVGIDLSKNFFVKFQQFDNFPAESDGIAFDNIRMISRPAPNLPPIAVDQLVYINENPLQGLVVAHVQANDPNPGDALHYEIVSGNDTATVTGVFSIDPLTGVIRVDKPEAVDFETSPVFHLGIRVTDGGTPAQSGNAQVTVVVKNVVERDALFFDDFESGTLAKWTSASSNTGRVQVTTQNAPAQGLNHMTFDSTSNSATNSLNEAGFSFDGTGYTDLILSMYQREFNDEDHPLPEIFTGSRNGDGISISTNGTKWYRVDSLVGPNSSETYQYRQYDLSGLAAQHGLNLQQTVYVKLQAYDNFSIPFDGMGFDDVLVDGVPAGGLGLPPSSQGIAGLAIEGGQLNWHVTSKSGNIANGLSRIWGTAGPASQGVLEVKTGDFNGDGRDDVALQNVAGEWWIGLSDGTHFNQFRWTHWAVNVTTFSHVSVGDFNGDGRDDLLGMASNGDWWVGAAEGTQFGNYRWTNWNPSANWQDIQVGDFNGDGLDDVAGRTSSGDWWIAASNGTRFQNSKWGQWSSSVIWQDVKSGDFNGDGLTDIIGRSGNGVWWASLSQGNHFVTSKWGHWSSAANWQNIEVGDFNGDGLTDITGRAGNGKWWTGLSQGNAFATTYWGAWSSTANWNDVVVGDFNADGRDDVAGRLDNGTWWNALSQGNHFLNQRGAQWDSALTWTAVTVGNYNAPAVPVTPPPAAPAPAPVFVGNILSTSGTGSTSGAKASPSLVYVAPDASGTQASQGDSSNSGSFGASTNSSAASKEASVEDLFGDQSLLDLLADLG